MDIAHDVDADAADDADAGADDDDDDAHDADDADDDGDFSFSPRSPPAASDPASTVPQKR